MANNVGGLPLATTAVPASIGEELEHSSSPTRAPESEYEETKQLDDDSSSDDQIGLDHHKNVERVRSLARTMSHLSTKSRGTTHSAEPLNPFSGDLEDPEMDPKSGSFNARKYMSNMLKIYSRDPEKYPTRTAGVSFRNLNVFGYGSAADYQPDVLNVWGINSMKNLFGLGKKNRIDILRNFEGLVKSGELLVVLGRPGR